MSGKVLATAVEGQAAPAAAERGDPAVGVLEVEQPRASGDRGLPAAPVGCAEPAQRPQRAGGVVGVGHAAGAVRPGPSARCRPGVRVLARVLLIEQPSADRLPPLRIQGGVGQRVDRQRSHPRGEVRVDGPGPAGSHAGAEELDRSPRHARAPLRGAGRQQAHQDEARQRRGFQEPAAFRLDFGQHAQRPAGQQMADRAKQGVPRRPMMVARLPDGDQSRQGVTHDVQAEHPQRAVWAGGQLERQLRDVFPRVRPAAEPAGQRAHRQDRGRERPVLAVSPRDGRGKLLGGKPAGTGDDVRLGGGDGAVVWLGRPGRCGEGRPAQKRRGQVGPAANGVAPAAVVVLVIDEPVQAAADEPVVGIRIGGTQREDRRRGGQGAVGQLAHPVPGRRSLGQEPVRCGRQRRAQGGSAHVAPGGHVWSLPRITAGYCRRLSLLLQGRAGRADRFPSRRPDQPIP